MHFEEWMERVVQAFEVAGVGILAIGSLAALVGAARAMSRGERGVAYERARRRRPGGPTRAGGPDHRRHRADHHDRPDDRERRTLALIVLVRTFLSFSLEIELEGAVPWHRRRRPDDRR